ncbi:MAG: UvrY/SirA/GacA family response regulator transcription factor [Gammaproteobacteria bacterium]|nr:UvrY/SirA/GacA family response regulator transcription factor [Gammaproteobacteria bacterium]NIR85778.1 UvrY/SirA/GacA family response regulator transcription factor [Gammaproteobacteria bacterium]NIV75710.1 UvrY/SirA/GacA family response regulator transcription factor [Gammaproteobacteria bacterium]
MISVVLVDDHDLVRAGLKRLLEDTRDLRVVAEAGSGEEALRMLRRRRPDVVLMDVNMPGMGGLEATRRLRQLAPEVKVIVVTVHVEQPYPRRLLEAGAAGYLTKGSSLEEIVSAIRAVHAGERYISADIAQRVALSMVPGAHQSPFDRLSQREMQVLLMFTQGHSVPAISEKLNISRKTVSTYRHRLFAKLEVHSDMELLKLAMRHGMIEKDTAP